MQERPPIDGAATFPNGATYFFHVWVRPDPAALDPGLQILVEDRQGNAAGGQNGVVKGAQVELRPQHLLRVLAFLLDLGPWPR